MVQPGAAETDMAGPTANVVAQVKASAAETGGTHRLEQSVSIRLPDGESICVGSEKRHGKVDFTAPVTVGCGRPPGCVVAVNSPPETTLLLRRSCITQVRQGNLLGELLR